MPKAQYTTVKIIVYCFQNRGFLQCGLLSTKVASQSDCWILVNHVLILFIRVFTVLLTIRRQSLSIAVVLSSFYGNHSCAGNQSKVKVSYTEKTGLAFQFRRSLSHDIVILVSFYWGLTPKAKYLLQATTSEEHQLQRCHKISVKEEVE